MLLLELIILMNKITELEASTAQLESVVAAITSSHESFEDFENELDSNLETAVHDKDFAFALCTLYLAQQKLCGALKATDPVLKTMKKVQERDKRVLQISRAAEEEQKRQTLAEQVFDRHFQGPVKVGENLRKRNEPSTPNPTQ